MQSWRKKEHIHFPMTSRRVDEEMKPSKSIFVFNSRVGMGSEEHCLSGSDKTSLITSASVTGENNRSSHSGGAPVNTGGAAPAVAARTSGRFM